MNALELIGQRLARRFRSSTFGLDELVNLFTLDGGSFALNTTMTGDVEQIEQSFAGYIAGAYRSNGIVFACMMTRFLLFSEARFQFQQLRGGRPGNLFGTPDLGILEHPEPGKTTGDLLARALLDVDLAGNWFGVLRAGRIKRLRPDWVTIVLGTRDGGPLESTGDVEGEVIGYGYQPGGPDGSDVVAFGVEEVAHFAPIPDPFASYRGMSWLTPILREIRGDSSATNHKLAYFRNSATPNMVVTLPVAMDEEKAKKWIALFDQEHSGVVNAYKTIYFGGGATGTVVGSNMQQQDFKNVQGAGETRIAAAAGVHPVIVALSEGLAGSALNAGNFASAARLTGDKTIRPLLRNMAGSLEAIIPAPAGGTRLWYDDRDIAFFRTDVKDAAEITQTEATTIGQLIKDGFTPESATDAVVSRDMNRLVHTGLVSVQLQPPGTLLPSGQPVPTPGAELLTEHRIYAVRQEEATTHAQTLLAAIFGGRTHARAKRDFWASSGQFAGSPPIPAGTELPLSHPFVSEFPSLFEPVVARELKAVGPGRVEPIVSRERVEEARRELVAAGKPAGYDSIARELNVSRDTVRRRLRD